jgi:hypothetical protein
MQVRRRLEVAGDRSAQVYGAKRWGRLQTEPSSFYRIKHWRGQNPPCAPAEASPPERHPPARFGMCRVRPDETNVVSDPQLQGKSEVPKKASAVQQSCDGELMP